ncbi:MAG: hypothetical protein AOY29_06690 [Alcanivorax borkumensis]|jgi:hypothetical protein|uniref:DUF4397 domain-containing protein n=1 Tax=Alcanivorax borkumensis (strain ATCC 700651 / DSM 11573 / NCIMB 13689 / SK2) TaxID=393595 RepID=Q0VL73_ALCBS|nr:MULTISPECIES: hypothetical protein [Alcanivorax]OJH06583.1 MAG: hypothetical protein AOY29_06690 [Alcanivorax borkumensis]EUC70897.1 hypothetical protein Y017_07930 [Alcanivorax sp. 97CO-5]PKG02422.1 hypothetical protein Y019_03735 [Alcanivorax sp. 97CO-6]CAL18075.1 hypothetical protein predicted by Glimmer/Critica [Alcanivorax borkumensis SK2]BAP15539.1 hypothetical protein AS19_26880 [Alcanivorax sp. NBRC 101098]
MIFLRLVMAASVVGLSAFGCDEDDDLFSDSTRLYFHNQLTQVGGGSEDDITVDLFVDDQNSALESDVDYTTRGNVSVNSLDLDDDSQSVAFDVRGSSSGSSLVSGPINRTLIAGNRYTVVLMGDTTLDNRQLKTFSHQKMDVASGQIRVRFINTLSRLSGDELSVTSSSGIPGGQPLVSGLEYADGSSYVSLSAGSNLTVTINNETQGVMIDEVSCSVSSGRSYDAIIAYTEFDSDDDQISLYCQPFTN